MDKGNKKGVSDAAKDHAKDVRRRFIEFLSSKGLSEVANKSGCNYQALRNSYIGIDQDKGYNPSLETIFQVKLGYGDKFDEVYVFTGRKLTSAEAPALLASEYGDTETESLKEQLRSLQEKLTEREAQIQELKEDKAFLQSIIKKQ